MSHARALYSYVHDVVDDRIAKSACFRATIESVSNNLVTISTPDGSTPSEPYAVLDGIQVHEDDHVICAVVGGSPLILGKISESGTRVYTFDGKFDSVIPLVHAQATSDTASTGNTSSLVQAMNVSLVLSEGTWDVHMAGGQQVSNSAGSNVRVRCSVGANFGSEIQVPAPSSSYTTAINVATITGVTGTVNATVWYCTVTGGTTAFSRNPWTVITARRTG